MNANFIEVTNTSGKKKILNINNIAIVEPNTKGGSLITLNMVQGTGYNNFAVIESYEAILNLLK